MPPAHGLVGYLIPQLPEAQPSEKLLPALELAAKAENNFSAFSEWHFGQLVSDKLLNDLCSTSNFVPQSVHLYSKIGIVFLFYFKSNDFRR